jgi:hypothetical protein
MVSRFKEDNIFYCITKKSSIDAGGARKWNVEVGAFRGSVRNVKLKGYFPTHSNHKSKGTGFGRRIPHTLLQDTSA